MLKSVFTMKNQFKDKKVLLIGLGILGGGVSIANWLVKQSAKLSITDSKPREYFKDSIKEIKVNVTYFFENCSEQNIADADIIVLNQAVPQSSPLVQIAERLGKPIFNESKIFYENCTKPIIAITGTRGKTTTTNWVAHLLGKGAIIAGNSTAQPLLKMLPKTKNKECRIVVNEIPSFQLERFNNVPKIALITNIFVDHLARHGTMENYALAKANIFKNQSLEDILILNDDNEWTRFFLKQNPQAEVWYFSLNKLPENKNGLYYDKDWIYLKIKGSKTAQKILDVKSFYGMWGKHNLANLLSAMLAAHLAGESWTNIKKRIKSLPQVKFRQELIATHKKIDIVNDTTATSPEGGIAAAERFGSPYCVLISGGTDSNLDYKGWDKAILKYIKPENILLLNGSATKKMLAEFLKNTDASKITLKETLEECVDVAFQKISALGKPDNSEKHRLTILFSPSAKSFEKFKNEFDRGEQFNKIIRRKITDLRKNR